MNIKQQYIVLYAQDHNTTTGFVKLTYQGDETRVNARVSVCADARVEVMLDNGMQRIRLPLQAQHGMHVANHGARFGGTRIVVAVCDDDGLLALGESRLPKANWHLYGRLCKMGNAAGQTMVGTQERLVEPVSEISETYGEKQVKAVYGGQDDAPITEDEYDQTPVMQTMQEKQERPAHVKYAEPESAQPDAVTAADDLPDIGWPRYGEQAQPMGMKQAEPPCEQDNEDQSPTDERLLETPYESDEPQGSSVQEPDVSPCHATADMDVFGTDETDPICFQTDEPVDVSTHSRLGSFLGARQSVQSSNGLDGDAVSRAQDNHLPQDVSIPKVRPYVMPPLINAAVQKPVMFQTGDTQKAIKLNVEGPYAQLWKWRRVTSKERGYSYLMGEVEQSGKVVAVAVAVPGVYAPAPPPNLQGFTVFREGYWLLAQDAQTGERLPI